jgi:hypothetical protein
MGQPSTSNQIRLQLDASIILPLTKTSKGKSFCEGGEGEGGQALLLQDRLQLLEQGIA